MKKDSMRTAGLSGRRYLKKHIGLDILFLIYLAILLRITVFRSGFSLDSLMQDGIINLTLFEDYIPLISQGKWLRFIYLFAGNIVWFVPLGAYLIAAGRVKNAAMAVLLGLALSLAIECMQYVFGTGVSELDDLVLNTLGAWIGAGAVSAARGRIQG